MRPYFLLFKKKSLLFLFFLPFLLPLFFLEKKKSPYTNYKLEETLRYPILAEPPTLDWSKSQDTTSSLIIQNLMEGLTEYDFSKDFVRIKPALAKSWTSSEDKKVWTFHLRKDVIWTDGKPLLAKQFLEGWERLLNPKTGSEYAYYLFPIKNAKAYNSGKIKDFSQVGVKVRSEWELEVTLEKGIFYFPFLLTHPCTYPIRSDIIKEFGSSWIEPENLASLGPYKLKAWEHDKALILEKSTSYYKEMEGPKKVIVYILPDESTIKNLYLSQKIDVATPLVSRELPIFKKRKDHRFHSILSLYYYGFQVEKPFVKNKNFRKAFIHSIDRSEIVKLLGKDQEPLKSFIPEGILGFNEKIGLGFDPKKAREFLKKSGFDKNLPKIHLFYNHTSDHKLIAENIQAQVKKNLGLTLELNSQEWKTYLQRLSTGEVEIFRLGWLADYPDPNNFMKIMISFSENNNTKWKNKEYDKLVLKAQSEENVSLRKAFYDEAQRILLEEEAVVLPLFSGKNHLLISPRIKNFPQNVMSQILFKDIRLEGEG